MFENYVLKTIKFNLILDVGMVTLTQYILLDPILLFFVSGSVMGMVKVKGNRKKSFSLKWWLWLIFTGIMLAGAVSVKFVGLFVILLVGIFTVVELWEIFGDLSLPVVSCLIIFKFYIIIIKMISLRQ